MANIKDLLQRMGKLRMMPKLFPEFLLIMRLKDKKHGTPYRIPVQKQEKKVDDHLPWLEPSVLYDMRGCDKENSYG